MQFNSSNLSMLVATCFALWVSMTLQVSNLWMAHPWVMMVSMFLITFLTVYLSIKWALSTFFFTKINQVIELISTLIQPHKLPKSKIKKWINPLDNVIQEIKAFKMSKEKEIAVLQEREDFRREFIADVSHELKTPLFAAQGFVHTLLDGAIYDKEVRKKFLKKAAKSLDALDLLVQDILTISQIESGEIKMYFEYFDITELCQEVVEQLDEKAKKKGVELMLSKKFYQTKIVKADYRRIYQVLLNLVSNAIKYAKKKGFCKIKLQETEETVRIIVEDNGRGIPEKDISRIFERFYRVEKSRTREKGGTGLGLSIVKHILESHHSQIMVESTFKKGSKFYFDLKKKNASTSII